MADELKRRVAALAGMAATIAVGVAAVLALPGPGSEPGLELARPAPVTPATLPDWAKPPPSAAPVEAATARPEPTLPLRTRRLETAQAARPHIARPTIVKAHATHLPPIVVTPARSAACRAPRTDADRLVCASPALAAQDREMRQAYERALAAGADRLKVDRAQARWRAERDRATRQDELARLYARRIGELDRAARRPGDGGGAII